MSPPPPLIAGNWKMNGLSAAAAEIETLKGRLAAQLGAPPRDILICPPATLIAGFAGMLAGSAVAVGAQDCHAEPCGAFTGDLSAEMLKDAGASAVIVGHSERRMGHGERDRDVRAKAAAAHRAGLTAIVCVGETAGERRLGLTLAVIGRQLAGSLPDGVAAANTVIAYEPVWAIGTGLTPSPGDVAAVHGFIRSQLDAMLGQARSAALRILYGGSVKPGNAGELLAIPDVNGALVGGASLKAEDLLGIIQAVR